MGFERLVRAIQHKSRNYTRNLLMPLLANSKKKSGKSYGKNEQTDIAFPVISYHIRAIILTMRMVKSQSQYKAGYVIREFLNVRFRYGYTFLGFNELVLYEMTPYRG